MPELVSIPLAYFEYTGQFERPVFAMWVNRVDVIQRVFDSMQSWGIDLENVEGLNEGKVKEQGVAFRLPSKKIKVTVNPAQLVFAKDQSHWSEEAEIVSILSNVREAVLSASDVVIKSQKVAIALHIQPKLKNFREILKPFWPESLVALQDSPLLAVANVLKWEDASLTLDGSASIKNGIFMRMELSFPKDATLQEIAQSLRRNEERLFTLLGIEEER